MNKEILKKYNEKVLGHSFYKDGASYKASELSSLNEAYLIMWEVWNHEGALSKDGVDFLREYYGLENLAELFSKKGGFDESKKKESILEWLNGLENETID